MAPFLFSRPTCAADEPPPYSLARHITTHTGLKTLACDPKRTMLRRLIATLVVLTLSPSSAFAQAEPSPPAASVSEEQVELNEEGVRAIVDGDFARAVALLKESLLYGEANIIYLNLGRAYQKQGNCDGARDALNKVAAAPKVAKPPPEIVQKQARAYLEELEQTCGAERLAAATRPSDEPQGANTDTSPPKSPPVAAWSLMGAGVALGASAAVLGMMANQQRAEVADAGRTSGDDGVVIRFDDQEAARVEQRANLYDTLALSAGITGTAVLGLGAYLLFAHGREPHATSFGVDIGHDRAEAVVRWRF